MIDILKQNWKQNRFVVCRLLSEDEVQLCLNAFSIFRLRSDWENDGLPTGDHLVPKSFSCYALPWFEALMLQVQPRIESIIEEEILPGFSYARFYHPGATLPPHQDRPAAEISTTITLSVDPEPWPIWVANKTVQPTPIYLQPGEALIYPGLDTEHWREEYLGNEQAQVFLHYVRANGPYTEWRLDSRPNLGLPETTRKKQGRF